MAIMIPSVISPDVSSSAERRIFDWFQNAPHTEGWIVLHSLGISTHNRVIYGETDFFVLVPKLGVYAIEVKGGRLRRENGIWYYTDKHGKTNSKVRGPFDQAKDGAFSIMAALKKKLDTNHRYLANTFFGYGVMFPDVEYEATGIDEEQWQVFDSRDGRDVKRFINRLASGAREKWETIYGFLDESRLPSPDEVRYLASVLRGDFDLAVSLSAQLRNADEALIALTKEQYRCLDQLDDNQRCLIQGPAGTGKTVLAVEEVKKSAARGERVALFCFNSNLANWLNDYFRDMPESVRPQFVGTLHSFMAKVIATSNYKLDYPHDEEELQKYYAEHLPLIAMKVLCDSDELFDKIVVDEAQDLISTNYLDVLDACLKRGFIRGRWTLFGDFSRQAIYSNGKTDTQMKELLEDYTSFIQFKLTTNCRNTKPICEEIQTVTGFKAPAELWTRVDGPPVNYITYSSVNDEIIKLSDLLGQLHEMHIEPGNITILSPRRRESSIVARLSQFDVQDFVVPNKNRTAFCTIQAYKGLENMVIILVDIEDYGSDKLMYIGLSRARSGLYVLESDNAAKEYQALLRRRLFHE